MKDRITITINGPTGSGKSAIWQTIALALARHGIETNPIDQLDDVSPQVLSDRLAHVKERAEVTIIEQNLRR